MIQWLLQRFPGDPRTPSAPMSGDREVAGLWRNEQVFVEYTVSLALAGIVGHPHNM